MMIFFSLKLLIVFFHTFRAAHSALKTYDLQELCSKQATGTLILESPTGGTQSSAILVSNDDSRYSTNTNCSVVVRSRIESDGIVISIRKIDLEQRNKDTLRIQYETESNTKSEKVYRYSNSVKDDPSENESFLSIGKVRITFESGPNLYRFSDTVFKITLTTVQENCDGTYSTFQCGNSVCIAKELKCDGHNHCGDRSDQEKCDEPQGSVPYLWPILGVFGILLSGAVVFICILAGKCKCLSRVCCLNRQGDKEMSYTHDGASSVYTISSSEGGSTTKGHSSYSTTYGRREDPYECECLTIQIICYCCYFCCEILSHMR